MRNLKLTLAYDGTNLVGWQRQPEGTSVQLALEEALGRLQGRPVTVVGAGRTDAGVHAAGQVASVAIDVPHDTLTLRRALNAVLPESIRVLSVEDAPKAFHARFAATSKTYHYRILNGPVASPFLRRFAWHVPWTLDAAAMAQAADRLVGEHDFAAFQSTGGDVRTSVRRLHASAVLEAPGSILAPLEPGALPGAAGDATMLLYVVEGSGFLRHMVRAIVGTLVEIGSRRATPDLMSTLLERRDRSLAGPTAPARGLCLAGVRYDGARLRLDGKSL